MLRKGLYGGKNRRLLGMEYSIPCSSVTRSVIEDEGGEHVAEAHRDLLQKVDKHGTSCPHDGGILYG